MMVRRGEPETIQAADLGSIVPHLRVSSRTLRARSRWYLERGLWTDCEVSAESADALEGFAEWLDAGGAT